MSNGLHNKYRPRTLDEVVGHSAATTRLKGIIKSKSAPSALAFFGPTSVGKTTLARAFTHDLLNIDPEKALGTNPNYLELDGSQSRTIEDIRQVSGIAKLAPVGSKHRVILFDEAQGILSNKVAADATLRTLENPPKSTVFILCSMEPDKFSSSSGKAIANRCVQFLLKPPSVQDLFEQGKRIIKGEKATYLGKEVLTHIANNCNNEMRTLANMIEACIQYYDGLGEDAPAKLTADDVSGIIIGSESSLEVQAVRILTAVYARKFSAVQREILDVTDGFGLINKMLYANWFILNDLILKGQRHPKVWGSKPAYQLRTNLNDLDSFSSLEQAKKIAMVGMVSTRLAALLSQSKSFSIPEDIAVSQFAFNLIMELRA